jgi:hypothetical protein
MTYVIALASLVAASLISVGGANADPSVVPVNAADAWVSTSSWVEPGQTYAVSAVGRAFTVMPNGIFPTIPGIGRPGESGPEGQIYICTDIPGFTCAVNGAPFGQLVGSVGGVGFGIGDASTFAVPTTASAGYLQLAVNDYLGWYGDNSGGYTVTLG